MLVMAIATAVVSATPLSLAMPAHATAPPQQGGAIASSAYRFVATYFTHALCVAAGDGGVQRNQWDSYLCRSRQAGLDVQWRLYVTP
jgi:hypothetical protein